MSCVYTSVKYNLISVCKIYGISDVNVNVPNSNPFNRYTFNITNLHMTILEELANFNLQLRKQCITVIHRTQLLG